MPQTAVGFRRGIIPVVCGLVLCTLGADVVPTGEAPPAGDLPAGALARLGTTAFRQQETISGLLLTPDGTTLIVLGWTNGVSFWDAELGICRARFRYTHDVKKVVSGRLAGAGRLLILSDYGWQGVYDAQSGRELFAAPGAFALDAASDGKWVAYLDQDLALHLRTLGTGKDEVLSPAPPASEAAAEKEKFDRFPREQRICFSPDGKRLAWSSEPRVLRVRELASGRTHELKGGGAPKFSPDSATIAAAGEAATIRVWDAADGKLRGSWKGEGPPAFSPDGALLASSTAWAIELRAVATWERKLELQRAEGKVTNLSFSAMGRQLASTVRKEMPMENAVAIFGRAEVWSLPDGKPIAHLPEAKYGEYSTAFSPDGRYLAAWFWQTSGNRIVLWDLESGKAGPVVDRKIQTVFEDAVFSPDGKTLYTSDSENFLRRWDTATGKELVAGEGHEDEISCIRYAPDGKVLATSGGDSAVMLWDRETGKLVRTLCGEGGRIHSFAIAPDASMLAAQEAIDTVRIWDPASGKTLLTLDPETRNKDPNAFGRFDWHLDRYGSLAFSADGRTLISGSGDVTARLWNLPSGREEHALILGRPTSSSVEMKFCLAAGGALAVTEHNSSLCFWDTRTGKDVFQTRITSEKNESLWTMGMAVSADGCILALRTSAGMQLWEVATAKLWKTLPFHHEDSNGVALSSDGTRLAWAEGCDVVVCEADGSPVARLRGHLAEVTVLAFAPDGKELASGSKDTTVLCWALKPPPAHEAPGDLERRWEDAASSDPQRGLDAVQAFRHAGAAGVAFIQARLEAVKPPGAEELAALLRQMDLEDPEIRGQAMAKLEAMEDLPKAFLEEALQNGSLEVRTRVQYLLQRMERPMLGGGEYLRWQRAIQALEGMRAPERAALLKRLAESAPWERVRRMAQQARSRIR